MNGVPAAVAMGLEEADRVAELERRAELALNLLALALVRVLGTAPRDGDWMSVMDAYDVLEGRAPGASEPLSESVRKRAAGTFAATRARGR